MPPTIPTQRATVFFSPAAGGCREANVFAAATRVPATIALTLAAVGLYAVLAWRDRRGFPFRRDLLYWN